MAARAPTGFTSYNNLSDLIPRKQVKSGTVSSITDDQQFLLDKEELLASLMFAGQYITGAAYLEIARFFIPGRNMCGNAALAAGAQENYAWTLLAWNNTAVANFDIRLTNVGLATTSVQNIVANQNTPLWRGWANLQCYADGTDNEILVEAKEAAALGHNISVVGIGIFSA
jgi:hypothetical protein